MSENLYERIGGKEAVSATVNKMYEKILQDPLLTPFFETVDIDTLHRSQKLFVAHAFGAPTKYDGKSLRAAHQHLVDEKGMGEEHFNAVAGHLKSAMEELHVPTNLIEEALSIVGSVKNDVLCQ